MTGRRRLSAALLVLLLSACAQQARLPSSASWDEHNASLRGLTHWSAEGKISLRTPEQSESAALRWLQREQHSRLLLSGPLGMSSTSVESDGKTLVIRQGEESQSWDLANPGALAQSTGWDLPLAALPYWLKGMPAPMLAIQTMTMKPEQALLASLQQDDWQIRYEAYADYAGLALPTRLNIQRRDTTLRLIIRDWQVPPG